MIRSGVISIVLLFMVMLAGCQYGTTISFDDEGVNIYPTDPRGEGPFRNHPQILSENKIYD